MSCLLTKKSLSWELVRAIFDINSDPMLVLDEHGKLVIANTAFAELSNLSQKKMQDKDIWSLLSGIFQDINLQSNLQNALQEDQDFRTGLLSLIAGQENKAMLYLPV